MVVATKKLKVTTDVDPDTKVKTITYNLPITQYTVNTDGSGSFTKPDGSIKFNDIAMVVGQSYNDRYINVLTTDGINGWVLCYQLTIVN